MHAFSGNDPNIARFLKAETSRNDDPELFDA